MPPPHRPMSIGVAALAFVMSALATVPAIAFVRLGTLPAGREAPFFYAPVILIFLALLPLHLIPFAVSRTRYLGVGRWASAVCSALLGAASVVMLYSIPIIESTFNVIRAASLVVIATAASYELLRRWATPCDTSAIRR